MAIIYSMRTAHSLLSSESTPWIQRSKSGRELATPWHTVSAWSALSPDRQMIWECALATPSARLNYLGRHRANVLERLADVFNPRQITWDELNTLGAELVEAGIFSLYEFSSMILGCKLEESRELKNGHRYLRQRRPDEPFNAHQYWHERRGLLRRLNHENFEEVDTICDVLSSIALIQSRDEK